MPTSAISRMKIQRHMNDLHCVFMYQQTVSDHPSTIAQVVHAEAYANLMTVREYQVTVTFDGAADEEFLIKTNEFRTFAFHLALDVEQEYQANPTSQHGYTITIEDHETGLTMVDLRTYGTTEDS